MKFLLIIAGIFGYFIGGMVIITLLSRFWGWLEQNDDNFFGDDMKDEDAIFLTIWPVVVVFYVLAIIVSVLKKVPKAVNTVIDAIIWLLKNK